MESVLDNQQVISAYANITISICFFVGMILRHSRIGCLSASRSGILFLLGTGTSLVGSRWMVLLIRLRLLSQTF